MKLRHSCQHPEMPAKSKNRPVAPEVADEDLPMEEAPSVAVDTSTGADEAAQEGEQEEKRVEPHRVKLVSISPVSSVRDT